MLDDGGRSLTVAGSIEDAIAAKRHGATILAGATWLMRDPRRGRDLPDELISLHMLPGFREIVAGGDEIAIGASVTHEALGRFLAIMPGFSGIAAAATGAANPAIRRVATVGGNICTPEFAAADLVPAFLAAGATVELWTTNGSRCIPFADFLAERQQLLKDAILTRVIMSRSLAASAHARLPLRKAGDYPVAIVSITVDREQKVKVAVGSVEPVARRWGALESAFAREWPVSAERAAALAAENNDCIGRDGIEAEGWYRVQVLPALVRRAITSLGTREMVA